jgi:hypothetical protein
MLRWIGCGCVVSLALAAPAMAQKYPGNTIPSGPTAPYSAPAPYTAPVPYTVPTPYTAPMPSRPPYPTMPVTPMQPSASIASPGSDVAAERFARSLPLDPAIRELRDQLPPNVPAVERALGLRPPRGSATDLRGRVPSPREIVDALAPR